MPLHEKVLTRVWWFGFGVSTWKWKCLMVNATSSLSIGSEQKPHKPLRHVRLPVDCVPHRLDSHPPAYPLPAAGQPWGRRQAQLLVRALDARRQPTAEIDRLSRMAHKKKKKPLLEEEGRLRLRAVEGSRGACAATATRT